MTQPVDLVLVTGAGASRAFGAGDSTLPLMSDFSDALIEALDRKTGYREVTGLERGLASQEFERRLGSFLQAVLAFRKTKSVVEASASFPTAELRLSAADLSAWHKSTQHHLDAVVTTIYTVVFDLFRQDRIAANKASAAYQALLSVLGFAPGDGRRAVLATTNYDTIAEHALEQAGWRPDAGRTLYTTAADPPINIERLLDGMPRNLPVLHLHGCLGWYRRAPASPVFWTNAAQHQSDFGVPVMLLPDPNKQYGEDPVIATLWEQFRESLRLATRVLLMGHSLNDQGLLTALKMNVPGTRIGVGILPEGGVTPGSDRQRIIDLARQELGDVTFLELRFDMPFEPHIDQFRSWLAHTEELGPRTAYS